METINPSDDYSTPPPVSNDDHLIGRCLDMCSERERIEREQTLDLSKWEIVPGTETFEYPKTDRSLAVKKYRRPAAGNVLHNAEDIRPPHILLKTLEYLVTNILNKVGLDVVRLTDAQKFVRDRTRAIRQDLTIQRAADATSVLVNESITRFHVFIDHQLAGVVDKADYDTFQNTEQLRKVLLSLYELYDMGSSSAHEGEMRACHLIAHLQSIEDLFRINRLLKDFPEVRQALAMAVAFYTGNLANYLNLMSRSTPLMSCLAGSHLDALRRRFLESIFKAHNNNLPLAYISSMLGFDSLKSTTEYLDKLGLIHEDGVFYLKQDATYPKDSIYIRSHIVDQKIAGLGWSELLLPDIHQPKKSPTFIPTLDTSRKTENRPSIPSAPIAKVNLTSLVPEISQSLLDFVTSHQAITIARDVLHHARQQNLLHSTRLTKQIATTAYHSMEGSFIQALVPTIKQIYWSSLQTKRRHDLQGIRERLSSLIYEGILLVAVKSVAFSTLSDLHYKSKLAFSTLSTWSAKTKSRSQPFQPMLFSRLLSTCKDLGIRHWNLAFLGPWSQISKLLSKLSIPPTTRMPSGSCLFDLSEASCPHISLTWYDTDAHIDYGSPPPSAVIAPSKSALLNFPLTPLMITALVDSESIDFGDQYIFRLLQQTPNDSESERLISLDIVTYFHSKYILQLPSILLPLTWQLIADAILDLLTPLTPPWSDHPAIPNPSPLLKAINNWNFSHLTDIEASFDFCEQHAFSLTCLYHKLHSVENRLQARIATNISHKLINNNDRQSQSLLEARGLEDAIQREQSRSEAFDNLLQNCLDAPLPYQS